MALTLFVGLLCLLAIAGVGWSLIRLSRRDLATDGATSALTAMVVGIALAAVMRPPVTSVAREPARRTQCKNHLKQISLAHLNYHNVWQTLPWQKISDPPQSWRVAVLPYLDQQPLFDEYQHRLPWNGPENTVFSRRQVGVLMCPSQRHQRDDQ